jgi:hypothetical protein
MTQPYRVRALKASAFSIERKGQAQALAAALATATTVLCRLMLTLLTGVVAVSCNFVSLSPHTDNLRSPLRAHIGHEAARFPERLHVTIRIPNPNITVAEGSGISVSRGWPANPAL